MATLMSDVEWIDAVYDDNGPLNRPWLGVPSVAASAPPDLDDPDDQGEYEYDAAQETESPKRFGLKSLFAAFNVVIAVVFSVFAVLLISNLMTGAPMVADVAAVAIVLFFPLVQSRIQKMAGNRRLSIYYRRMFVVTMLVLIAVTAYHWTQYGPMENPVIFLLGMGFVMTSFLVVIVTAVVRW